jgi:hypothetical protein
MKKTTRKNGKLASRPREKKDPNQYPKGWDRKRVQAVISHYENQSDDDAIAEDEAAYHNDAFTMMAVPIELVPRVQKIIGKRAG